MGDLATRLRRIGPILVLGIVVVVVVALMLIYLQQGGKQSELQDQINKLQLTLAKTVPSAENLQAEYAKVEDYLSSLTSRDILERIIDIARESGIDVNKDSGKFRIPPGLLREEKVGGATYQVMSFKNIAVQGEPDSVIAFISSLESGEVLETLVLRRVLIRQETLAGGGEAEAQGEGEEEVETVTVTQYIATMDVDIYTKVEGESP